MFTDLGKKYGKKNAFISDEGKSYSYDDLDDFSNSIKKLIPKKSLVISLCDNSIGSLFGYFSFIKNDIVPIMLDSDIDVEFLKSLSKTYSPDYIWLPEDKKEEFQSYDLILTSENYSLLKVDKLEEFKVHQDLALLLTTSGSTGSPKLVRLSQKNLYSNAKAISKYLSLSETDRPVTVLPMSYSFGLSIINSHLISGSTILLTNHSVVERDFWDFVKDFGATSISGVPYTFEILKKLRFFNMDISSLKTITQAGGKLNDEINLEFAQFCDNKNIKMFVMYGQTEATARMSYLPANQSLNKIGSIGIAIPGGKFSLIDDLGNSIDSSNIVGELVYRGDNVCLGYANCPKDLGKGDENNGILLTGDLAKVDEDGYYYIVGRKKRFIKIFGNRVNLDEVEAVLNTITIDIACTGIDDKLLIFITDSIFIDEIKKQVLKKMGINLRGFEVRVIDEIPKSSSGKIEYGKLRIR